MTYARREFAGMWVEALDGLVGVLGAAIDDRADGAIIVDTGPWIFGKKVLLPADAVYQVDFRARRLLVNRTRAQIANAPPYDDSPGPPSAPDHLDRPVEARQGQGPRLGLDRIARLP
jgi:hypothetical protein